MRLISFSLTLPQFLDGTKDVTRRLGWERLKPGDKLCACVKCQGLQLNEKVERIGVIRVKSVRREPLKSITKDDVRREGFPDMSPEEFVNMFCKTHQSCTLDRLVTRIEFERVKPT